MATVKKAKNKKSLFFLKLDCRSFATGKFWGRKFCKSRNTI
ncbi:hypothetical protein PPIS_b0656 [Pseudoalteromonas piscicida]|uniref:Uncharacterized protein n=1 Tax=Pseudoalteromonas piscicida TaxID=43662 RepID=A0ABM6NLS8_PSEO7|nr:hypothetical protein PPIS_b0656 [Pseudoalteromonas piscicida]